MRTSESVENISKALSLAQGECPGVPKTGVNSFDRYKYATLEDYVVAVKPVLNKHGLSMVFSSVSAEKLPTRKTSKGNDEHVTLVGLDATLLHSSGEWVSITAYGEGQDRGDKSVYKAITGARKYAVACLLGLATTDDPEETPKTEEAPQQHPTIKKSDPRQIARDLFISAVSKWTGITEKGDILAAAQKTATKMGREAKSMTAMDFSGATAAVEKLAGEGVDFFQWSVA